VSFSNLLMAEQQFRLLSPNMKNKNIRKAKANKG
jgi:hypothetical protein